MSEYGILDNLEATINKIIKFSKFHFENDY